MLSSRGWDCCDIGKCNESKRGNMGTLNIKFNKYWYKHTLATLKWRLEYKLQMSKMPWGKLYRHFWRKRLMKRINEVATGINQRHIQGIHVPAADAGSSPINLPPGWIPYRPDMYCLLKEKP